MRPLSGSGPAACRAARTVRAACVQPARRWPARTASIMIRSDPSSSSTSSAPPPPAADRDGTDETPRWQSVVRRLLPITWLAEVIVVGWRELSGFSWATLRENIQALPSATLLGLLLLGAAGVLAMGAYDTLLARWSGITVPRGRLLRYSGIANSFNIFVGFSGLAGSGSRYLLLSREGVNARDALAYSGTIMVTIPVGLGVLAWPTLLGGSAALGQLGGARWLSYLAVIAFALYVPLYWWLARSARLQRGLHIDNVALDPVHFLLAALVTWACMYAAGAHVDLLPFIGAFVLAAVLGVFSMLPGGLGVFDATLYYFLTAQGAPAAAVVAGLLVFRAVY